MSLITKLKQILPKSNNNWKPLDHLFVHDEYDGGDFEVWLRKGISGYKQWYQPVQFTNEIHASVTVPPLWIPNPDLDYEWGLGRWNDIIKPNLPDVNNARILDLGCSSGLYSLELCKLGAKEVIGVDRDSTFTQKSSPLPMQDVISQAKFVKTALEIINKVEYPVEFLAGNFADLEFIEGLGHFDFILALNVVYHELDAMPKLLKSLSKMTDKLVLQASQGHGNKIGYWANIPKHIEILIQVGFTDIRIVSPKGYLDPLIVASK